VNSSIKVIYVAGPFRSPTPMGIARNVRAAEEASLLIWQAGGAALCPHMNTANFDKSAPDEVFLLGTMEFLRRCDAAYFLPTWPASQGARAERDEAMKLGIPCFYDMQELKDWLAVQRRPGVCV
jgi:hypothetical protein